MTLDSREYVRSLRENIDLFRAAGQLGLEPTVPACPDWTVGQLVVHLAEVYDFWSTIVASKAADTDAVKAIEENRRDFIEQTRQPEFYGSSRALEYFDEKAARIVDVLSSADPAQANWTWWPGNQTAGFVQRRMSHETAIHRWDCQAAHHATTPIAPPRLAADGIDEELQNELTGWGDEGKTFPSLSFHVHCEDAEGEWLIVARETSVELSREHAKADVAITGAASDIYLWLWHRTDSEGLKLFGDEASADLLRDMLDQD